MINPLDTFDSTRDVSTDSRINNMSEEMVK